MRGTQSIGMVPLSGCRCRCGHEWLPRDKKENPRVCPKCKSPYWDRPKLRKKSNADETWFRGSVLEVPETREKRS